jgi:hypothetical protein
MEQVNPWILVGFNVLLGIAGFMGALWARRMESDMTEMRRTLAENSQRTNDRLAEKVGKDDLREFRQELRENFQRVFDGIDNMKDRIAEKADRA